MRLSFPIDFARPLLLRVRFTHAVGLGFQRMVALTESQKHGTLYLYAFGTVVSTPKNRRGNDEGGSGQESEGFRAAILSGKMPGAGQDGTELQGSEIKGG
jgi:hypothetical protein